MKVTDLNGEVELYNGLKMPYLGLGLYKTKEGDEVMQSINVALECGYRLIDTASYYNNEIGVGKAINNSPVHRSEIFVTTKVWNDDHGYSKTKKAFEKSLKKLNLNYIDLYLIHWPVPELYLETWKALEDLYKEGLVKSIGVSNCLEHHINEIQNHCEMKPMVVQNEFHPKLIQQNLVDFCKKNKIQYQAWSPLMRGQILDNKVLQKIAQKHQKTVAQIIIRWDLQKGVLTIPKSVNPHRIKENSEVFDFQLSKEEVERINLLDNNERTGAHPDHFLEHFKNK